MSPPTKPSFPGGQTAGWETTPGIRVRAWEMRSQRGRQGERLDHSGLFPAWREGEGTVDELLASVKGMGREWPMPDGLPRRVAVVTATYRSWSNYRPGDSKVDKLGVLRARLGPEGYQAEDLAIWDADEAGRAALAQAVEDAEVVIGYNTLRSHYPAWDRVVDVAPFLGRTADIFLALYEARGRGSAVGLGLSHLAQGVFGRRRERSRPGIGHLPATLLWDDLVLLLSLWETCVRCRIVVVARRPVSLKEPQVEELCGRKPRFSEHTAWAAAAEGLVQSYPPGRDPHFMLREGCDFARGALFSRAEYALALSDDHGRHMERMMVWLLAEDDLRVASEALGPAKDVAVVWSAKRLLWANYGQNAMPGIARLQVASPDGGLRLVVPDGQRSLDALKLAAAYEAGLLLLPDSRSMRRTLTSANPEQLQTMLRTAEGVRIEMEPHLASEARDALVRWATERTMDTGTWVAAQSASL